MFYLQEADTFMPDQMDISGECWEDESKVSLGWKGFILNIYFSKVIEVVTLNNPYI